MKRIKLIIMTLILIIFTSCSITVDQANINNDSHAKNVEKEGTLQVSVVDVGQGDGVLIKTPGGKHILVDSGSRNEKDKLFDFLKSKNINKFDVIVGTHPHEDHIGNLDDIIYSYKVDKVYLPKVTSSTKAFENLMEAVKKKNLKINTAKGGVEFEIDGVKFSFLAPNSTSYKEMNDYSAVLKVSYGKNSFLLMGDAEKLSENEILSKGYNVKADVIKLGHHGSHSSSGNAFIKAVNPSYAVISCGIGNDYGHPHKETLEFMKKLNIGVYRTDLSGTIIFDSNGNDVKLIKNK